MDIRRLFIAERAVIFMILVNTVALFALGFDRGGLHDDIWFGVDYACVIYFAIEAAMKIRTYRWAAYWADPWNRIDLIIVVVSLPVLAAPVVDLRAFAVVLVLRLGRLFRLFRLLRFLPDHDHMLSGILRALRASIGVFLAVMLVNFIFGMGAMMLFGEFAPEYFGNPVNAMYSMFQIFTIEGWYEIPDAIVANTDSSAWAAVTRVYFVVAVLVGGLLGLSLANAVFVDQMVVDNTDHIEDRIDVLTEEIRQLRALLEARAKD